MQRLRHRVLKTYNTGAACPGVPNAWSLPGSPGKYGGGRQKGLRHRHKDESPWEPQFSQNLAKPQKGRQVGKYHLRLLL